MNETSEFTPRRRRRLLTPLTGGLMAIIVAAGGFAAGAEAQKRSGDTGAAAGPAGFATLPTGGPPGMDAAAGDETTGTVTVAKGDTLYVEDADGNTVKVKVKSSAGVTRTASTDADEIRPGDTVRVTGEANENGTVRATAVTATEAATEGA